MSTIDLTLVSEERYLEWRAPTRTAVRLCDGLAERITLSDPEEAANGPMIPGNVTISFPDTTPYFRARRDLIAAFWPTSKAYKANPGPPPFEKLLLTAPGLPDISHEHRDRTLGDLGFSSGELLVLSWKSSPLGIAVGRPAGHSIPRTLTEFFDAVVDDPASKAEKEHDQPAGVSALVLYTEEDADLALYVRQYHSSIHVMSGFDLTFYFLEHIPSIAQHDTESLHAFWSAVLPDKWYRIWRAIGLFRSKPFPAARTYEIASELGIQPAQLPCMVFFHDWRKIAEERLVLPVEPPIPSFFRRVCTDVHSAFQTVNSPEAPQLVAGGRLSPVTGLRRWIGKKSHDRHAGAHITFQQFRSALPHWLRSANRADAVRRPESPGSGVPQLGSPRLFLCYAAADSAFADQLAFDLRLLGLGIWLDKWEIRVGDWHIEQVEKGLKDSEYLVLILSPDAADSDWVRKQWMAALGLEMEKRGCILPVLYRGDTEIPLILQGKGFADFRSSYAEGLQQLVERIAPEAVTSLRITRETFMADDPEGESS